MGKHHEIDFKTYDRLIPNQDTMPKGGFGNLIALPLQKEARNNGNSVFIDENFNEYSDQWQYLQSTQKYSLADIEKFIRELGGGDELGELRKESEDEKPWEGKKPTTKLKKTDFPNEVRIVRANMLYIRKEGFSNSALNKLKRLAAFRNPEFYRAQAMRLPTFDKPRIVSCSDETEQYLCLPRGLESEIVNLINENNINIIFIDKYNKGNAIDVEFNGTLRDEQQIAIEKMLEHDNGVLSATTAFGKTVIGAKLIAECKVNTLILVHRTSLLSQWVERLSEFLIINETPVVQTTPKGRKSKEFLIGQIGGGNNSISGIIDVAVIQSLISSDEVKDLVKNYGMVILDECHHGSAFTFEQVLKTTNAKYVYGLTATPTRKDGHHPIIYMQCGAIRYSVDGKVQAEKRPFEHFIIPRFTRFKKASENIVELYNDIQNSEIRNELIIADVIDAVNAGRNPIILTERKEHVEILAERLKEKLPNVIALTGGKTKKQSDEVLMQVINIPEDEHFVLIATGKYIGEGFDMPRLDTLFLVMPISWKGTLQQYVGRLHRLYEGKKEVQVYDYVDIHN